MWDWLLLVVGLVTALYWYLTWHYGYWKSKGVYCPPGVIPGPGHMLNTALFKESAGWMHCELYRKTKGHPAVGFYSFRKPALLVRDLNLVQSVLISEFSSFHDNVMETNETIDVHISKNPFLLKGQRWKKVRQQLVPAFTPSRIKVMFPLIQRVCQEFNSYMEKRQQEDIDVNMVTGLFTSEVVAKCAFGVDGNAFHDSNSEFYKQGRRIWDSLIYNPYMMLFVQYFPIVNKILRKSFVPPDVTAFFVSLVKQAADYRQTYPDKAPDNDYLQFLLNLMHKDEGFTIDDVVAQSLTFFTDGFETSSVTVSFAMYELTVNPDLQDAVRKEVMALDSFTYDNIMSLPLLDRVVQETLRKYSVFSLIRKCTEDHVLHADGLSFPVCKEQEVVVPVYAIHHDPEIYPKPEVFDPDRFLAENAKSRHPVSFMGFGAGPRTCIGYRFATCQVKVLLSNVLKHFRLIRCDKTEDKLIILPDQILPVSKSGIWARFQKL